MKQFADLLLNILKTIAKNAQTPPSAPAQTLEPKTEPKTEPKPTLQPVVAEVPKIFNFVSNNTAPLQESDYQEVAALLNIEVAAVKAVTVVESSGGGYLPSKRPKILFEAHLFGYNTRQKYTADHPSISSAKWNQTLYKGGEKEYDRLEEAMKLDKSAALKSASWGLFQILGSNHKACGFDTVEEFVQSQVECSKNQLKAFAAFVKYNNMDVHLRNKNWEAFARMYNGPGYKKNLYDTKLQQAYEKLNLKK
jgi:hypothetical protein